MQLALPAVQRQNTSALIIINTLAAHQTSMNLITYLESLPPERLAQLYESSWTCQAVLRSLPPIAKLYVMRLLLVQQPISAGVAGVLPLI